MTEIEQRVREEIGRDSERLDWLEQQFILMALVKGPAPVAPDKKLDAVFHPDRRDSIPPSYRHSAGDGMMCDWKDTDDILHIIAQPEHHGDAHILGTKEGLTRLRGAIDAALNTPNQTHKVSEMTNDGEGFYTLVQCVSADRVDELPLGYTKDYAKDESEWPEWIA